MKKLTEKSSYEELDKAWKEVNEYGERASNADAVKKAFKKKGTKTVYRRVNTPQKHRALYIIVGTKNRGLYMPLLIVDGSEGDSFVAREDDGKRSGYNLTVLHSHAIRRYIERHGWNGTLEECENHILDSMWISSRNCDPITKELVMYLDNGVFLGCMKDGICHLNTYVANQHLFPYQRLKSKMLQESIEKLMEEI